MNCEQQDKARHGPECVAMKHGGNSKEMELFHKWFDSDIACHTWVELATHAMTKEEFLNKNSQFFIDIEVSFSGNYCSFSPTKPPNIVYLSEIHPSDVAEMKHLFSYRNMVGPFEYGHVLVVRFQLDGKNVGRRRHQIFKASDYRRLPLQEAMTTSFNLVNYLENPILPSPWKDILCKNFFHQIQEWCDHAQKEMLLFNFVLSCYRYQSKESYKSPNQYALLIEIEMGEQLGEIHRIVSHSMEKISEMKEKALANAIKAFIANNSGDKSYVVFTLSFVSKLGHLDHILFDVPLAQAVKVANKKEKDYRKETRNLWQQLLKVPFPRCPPTPNYPGL